MTKLQLASGAAFAIFHTPGGVYDTRAEGIAMALLTLELRDKSREELWEIIDEFQEGTGFHIMSKEQAFAT